MPKRSAAHVRWNATRQVYGIWHDGAPVVPAIQPGGAEWEGWLEQTPSFAFEGADGAACTVRKETVQRGGTYWYAYRRVAGRMAKRYVGRAAEVTPERLEAVLATLAPPPAPLLANGEGERSQKDAGVGQHPQSHPQPGRAIFSSRGDLAPGGSALEIPVPSLLLTKLHVPGAARVIERPHVMQRLQRGLARPLTLVMAPAG